MAALLPGAWRLLDYWTRYDDGPLLHPLGERPLGYILYTPDGYMTGTMQRRGVAPFHVADRLQARDDEKVRAFDDYVTYCGRWQLEGDTVWHEIEASLLPNWIGERQPRRIVVHGPDRIDLVAQWQLGPRRRTTTVAWERAR
jgi:hypothetical protein